jgi:hypothetical protein
MTTDPVCTLCGRAGHRAHACPWRGRGRTWPFPVRVLDYPEHPPAMKPERAPRAPRDALPDEPAPF